MDGPQILAPLSLGSLFLSSSHASPAPVYYRFINIVPN